MAVRTTPGRRISAPRAGGQGYDVFISYSHAVDGRLAPALQVGLQSLAKPWYRRRALRVFRDKTSLSASPELWSAIESALSESRYFVLLASPEAANSHWVDQEVRWWRVNRSHDTCLIALTDGELSWDEAHGDFGPEADVPPGLRDWFPREPLWVDLHWAREEQDLSMRNPRFRDCVADLAAPVRGLPKDELIGEDISQHRRTLRLARGAVALLVTLLALAVVGGVVALVQRNNARNQTELALAGQVSATADATLGDRLDVAQLLAVEGHSRRETPQTTAALFRAATESPKLAKFADAGTPITALAPGANDEDVFIGGEDGSVRAWPVSRDRVGPALSDLSRPISAVQASEGGRYLAAGDEGGSVSVVDLTDGRVSRASLRGPVTAVAVADDGRWLAAASDDFQLTLYDLETGEIVQSVQAEFPVEALAFRDDARALFVGASTGSWQRRSLPALAPLGAATDSRTPASFYTAAYSANQRYFGMFKFGVWIWDTETDRRREFPITSTGEASSLAIAPDASRAAVATEGAISVVEEGGLITDPLTGVSAQTNFVAFLGSGDQLVSSSGSLLALWDLGQHSRISRPLPVRLPDPGTAADPPGLAMARDGRTMALTSVNGSLDPEVSVWQHESGRRVLPNPDVGYLYPYGAVALSSDGDQVVAAGGTGVYVWDLAGSSGPATVPSRTSSSDRVDVLEPDISADSMFAVWGDGRIDRLSLSAAELEPLAEPGDGTFLNDVEIAPEAELALQVMDGRMSQIDLATGQRSAGPDLGLETIATIGLSSDGHRLVAADGEESAVLWDMRSGEAIRRMAVGRVINLAVDQDARLMATLTGEGLMAVWDLGSGTKLGELQLAERGETIAPDRGVETTLRFSPDRDLWTATAGGGLVRWPMSPEVWEESICDTVNRSLTQEEWERYIGIDGSAASSCPDG